MFKPLKHNGYPAQDPAVQVEKPRGNRVVVLVLALAVLLSAAGLLVCREAGATPLDHFEWAIRLRLPEFTRITVEWAGETREVVPENYLLLRSGSAQVVSVWLEEDLFQTALEKNLELVENQAEDWGGIPHIYQRGNILILYVGEDTRILAALAAECGPDLVDPIDQ